MTTVDVSRSDWWRNVRSDARAPSLFFLHSSVGFKMMARARPKSDPSQKFADRTTNALGTSQPSTDHILLTYIEKTAMRGLALTFLFVSGAAAFTAVPGSPRAPFTTKAFGAAPSAFKPSRSHTRLFVGTQLDFHQTLGVSWDASVQEVKSAYRKLAKKWHPGMNSCRDVF